MNVRLNTKCSIAVHSLIVIAEFQEIIKVTSEHIARSVGCNSSAIRSILNSLQKAGIISITRGVGGARLNAPAEKITLWDIQSAIEPNALEHMIGIHPNPSYICPIGKNIDNILAEPYAEIANSVKTTMQKLTLKQIIDRYHYLVPEIDSETMQIILSKPI